MFDLSQFSYHISEREKFLKITREKERRSDAFSPGDMNADDVEYEMQFPKNREMITICGADQSGLEHFCRKYGQTYRAIRLEKCQLVHDLSPLGELPSLEYVDIRWNIRSEQLWDMRRNSALRAIELHDCRKITQNLGLLATAPALTDVTVCGSIFEKYPMPSLDVFAEISKLQYLRLYHIKPERKDALFLAMPGFERFDFDSSLYTTEEIARMVALHPHVCGTYFGAYGPAYVGAKSRVRVSGSRKPELHLPENQKRLDKYVAAFDALVQKYRGEAEA